MTYFRSIIALHNLINNKVANKEAEKKEGKKDDVAKDKKEADILDIRVTNIINHKKGDIIMSEIGEPLYV